MHNIQTINFNYINHTLHHALLLVLGPNYILLFVSYKILWTIITCPWAR